MSKNKNTPNNDQPAPIDPTHKLNEPVPFDPSQFGGIEDLASMKFPEPKIVPAKGASTPATPEMFADEASLFASVPKFEGKEALCAAAGSEQLRNAITLTLQKKWPAAYAHYRSLKYPVPGTEPTLEQRKIAYEFAFRAFLHMTYTKSFAEGQ